MSARSSRIAAVVLAAGLSRRMGTAKPLLKLGDLTVLERVLSTLRRSGAVDPIIVVTGHQAHEIAPIVQSHLITTVHNPAYAQGEMFSSVRAGIGALPDGVGAVMIVLCDQPLVAAETIATLAQAWRQRRPRVLLPCHEGKHGHPIMLSADGINEILALGDDATLKTYTMRHAGDTLEVEVEDAEILRDIDTPEEYERAVQQLEHASKTTRRSPSCPTEAIPPEAV